MFEETLEGDKNRVRKNKDNSVTNNTIIHHAEIPKTAEKQILSKV